MGEPTSIWGNQKQHSTVLEHRPPQHNEWVTSGKIGEYLQQGSVQNGAPTARDYGPNMLPSPPSLGSYGTGQHLPSSRPSTQSASESCTDTMPSPASTLSLVTSQSSQSPRTSKQFSGLEMLRDHGINLAQLTSEADTQRRPSVNSIPTAAVQRMSQGAQQRSHFECECSGQYSAHRRQNSSQNEVSEDENEPECGIGPEANVTKVIVIYMQNGNCSSRRGT